MQQPSFLNLSPDVVHVLGSCNSALYDLRRRRIFSLDEEATAQLKLLSGGQTLEAVIDLHPSFRGVLEVLMKNSLALIEDQKVDHNAHLNNEEVDSGIQMAWIEVGISCNHRCIHCYNFSGPALLKEASLNVEMFRSSLQTLSRIGTKTVKFIGGEPLAYSKDVRALIIFARELQFENIAVHTNGTLIDEEWTSFLKEYAVSVDVTVYGHTEALHEAVTQIPGSFNKTIQSINQLISNGCNGSINLIVTPHNEEALPDISRFFRSNFSSWPFCFDYIRPVGRARHFYEDLQFKYLNRYSEHKTFFPGISRDEYLARQHFNPCLQDKITITSSGDIFPCIMIREAVGNVRDKSLAEIIASGEFESYRKVTLDQVEVCKDCEYRYACNDCRAIPIGLGLDKYSKPPECAYNPYSGRLESNLIQLRRRTKSG